MLSSLFYISFSSDAIEYLINNIASVVDDDNIYPSENKLGTIMITIQFKV